MRMYFSLLLLLFLPLACACAGAAEDGVDAYAVPKGTPLEAVWFSSVAWAGSWNMKLFRQTEDLILCSGLAGFENGHFRKTLTCGETLQLPDAYRITARVCWHAMAAAFWIFHALRSMSATPLFFKAAGM